jgi:hypothetical protein
VVSFYIQLTSLFQVLPHHVTALITSINKIMSQLSSLSISDLTATPGPLTGSVFGDNVMGAAAAGGIVGSGKVKDDAVRAFGNTVAYLRQRIEEARRSGSGRWRDIQLSDQ